MLNFWLLSLLSGKYSNPLSLLLDYQLWGSRVQADWHQHSGGLRSLGRKELHLEAARIPGWSWIPGCAVTWPIMQGSWVSVCVCLCRCHRPTKEFPMSPFPIQSAPASIHAGHLQPKGKWRVMLSLRGVANQWGDSFGYLTYLIPKIINIIKWIFIYIYVSIYIYILYESIYAGTYT